MIICDKSLQYFILNKNLFIILSNKIFRKYCSIKFIKPFIFLSNPLIYSNSPKISLTYILSNDIEQSLTTFINQLFVNLT